MQNKNIKYEQLRVNDFEENEPRAESECGNNAQVHWTIKLLLVVFVVTQLMYVGRYADLKLFYRNASQTDVNANAEVVSSNGDGLDKLTQNASGVWGGSAKPHSQNFNTNDLLTSTTMDTNTVTSTITAISKQSYTNQTFFTDSIINYTSTETNSYPSHNHTTTAASTFYSTNVSYDDVKYSYPSIIQQATNVNGMANAQTFKKSHETTDFATNTSTANYLNATRASTTAYLPNTLTTLKQWETAVYPTNNTVAPNNASPTLQSSKASRNRTKIAKRQYFINTSKCQIPYINPLTPEVRKIFKPSHVTGCTNDTAIVSVSFDEVRDQYILHTNYPVAMQLMKNSNATFIQSDLKCCYRQIERSGTGSRADDSFTLLPCTNFHQDFVVPVHIQGVIVDCSSRSRKKRLQQDVFTFIQVNRKKYHQKENSSNGRTLGVMLIGIDSLSRINFRRNMPKTMEFLTKNRWYELQGYNKVGDNTLPNLMPLLSGYTKTTTYSKCKPSNVGGLDACNFIWSKFQQHGFRTAYAEDTAFISTFNYHMKGFLKPPTDHYFRPIVLGMEKTMKKKVKASLNYCIGRRQAGEYVYDYGLDFATRYRNHSNFGLFWTNSFSHNSFQTAATMDTKMMDYLKELQLRGILDHSVVVFFSDHGRRWGPLLNLPEGFLEERLPFIFLSLPSWMEREHSDYVRNLEINQKRLTTPFDIYMTLQDLLHMAVPDYKVTQAYDCPQSQSLFHEIPENRTCPEACIPDAWCTCVPYMRISHQDATVKRVTQLILDEMNLYFVRKNITSLCSELSLSAIAQAQVRDQDASDLGKTLTYMIDFATYPTTDPVTLFSATVNYDSKLDNIQLDVEDIARHSKYEDTAKCTNDKQAKKYCICRSSLKS